MTVINNATLILKDSQGNEGIVKSFTDNDIGKISNAITDVGQVVDPATHMPIEATKTSAGVVQLATAQDITNGTAGKVVDAQELINFAQTLPAANGVTDVSSGDNSNQLVVSRIGGSKTLTIDNVEHADNADEATHASQADTATSANSVAWGNVSGKPSSYTPSTHNHDSTYLKLSGGTITGSISKNNNATSWVQGRNVAPFKTIAASSPGDSQYVPCWSAKSYQGSWDCGPYISNVLHLSYITDANFNSNNNAQTADFTFATDGTFNATTLKENGTKLADKYQPKGSYVSTSTIWIG